jgi:glycosyltransferase involved in cell wall biosynthesis
MYDIFFLFIIEMENQKILFLVDFNLSLSAGNTIWCSNSINTYLTEGKMVEIWTSHPQQKFENIERNLLKPTKIRQVKNIADELSKRHLEFEEIIVRHHNFLSELKEQEWLSKTNLYVIEVDKFSTAITTYKEIWTQSEKLKKRLEEKGAQGIRIKEPIAYPYDFELPERKDDQIRLVYCGTLRDEENILEMINEFKKIHQERPNVLLKIVYGKIHGNKEFCNNVNQIIKEGVDGITFLYNLSHKDACYELATSDIGIYWRKKGWGENGEISTKLKEYKKYNLRVISELNNTICEAEL